jgi:hypothetical protein
MISQQYRDLTARGDDVFASRSMVWSFTLLVSLTVNIAFWVGVVSLWRRLRINADLQQIAPATVCALLAAAAAYTVWRSWRNCVARAHPPLSDSL